MTEQPEGLLEVGRISRPHGLGGDVSGTPPSDHAEPSGAPPGAIRTYLPRAGPPVGPTGRVGENRGVGDPRSDGA